MLWRSLSEARLALATGFVTVRSAYLAALNVVNHDYRSEEQMMTAPEKGPRLFSSDDLAAQLQALGICSDSERLAVAVSGGADSLALALMVSEIAPIVGLTVDHQLRGESADEADYVHSLLTKHDIEHHILRWNGVKPESNLQAEAREARYELLENWCRDNGIDHLLTAHHMNDQAETFLLRLARGSGVYGLASIEPVSLGLTNKNIKIVRPLLNFSKDGLKEYLTKRNIEWIDDPSNEKEQFNRVKVRRFLENPMLDGFTPERLAATANHFARTRDALRFYEAEWVSRHVVFDKFGCVSFKASSLKVAPEEIILRGLGGLIRRVSGNLYAPRFEKLYRLYDTLRTNDTFSGQTLMGTEITLSDDETLISRENSHITDRVTVEGGGEYIWDNRFSLTVSTSNISSETDNYPYYISKLGEDGWRELLQKFPEVRENAVVAKLPHRVKLSLPAVFDASGLRAVPHLEYSDLENIKISVSLINGALSKK
ncbi:tRNA lysidine(34) synthetase TilS [Kordiimonas sp. SCSIO 12610]|uniref:tRNA lysidine(34) synthetase TilS n=1 Tax=Kordiimonas sp. SCSIO 12610 TaxID=2829597 RepID=UPI00210AC206|nr:tRNA lysidine(34) synthetase TilS [Kordiimonas sp. SCSIO 12610]UTW56453.1 tRNA lysidine(34) synthetase TilS [Kordiimonas sp. SCSIO 12610]